MATPTKHAWGCAQGAGCLSIVVLAIVGIVIYLEYPRKAQLFQNIVYAAIGFVALSFAIGMLMDRSERRAADRRAAEDKRKAEDAAARKLQQDLNDAIIAIQGYSREFDRSFDALRAQVTCAQSEFLAKAYSPFWDFVVSALATHKKCVDYQLCLQNQIFLYDQLASSEAAARLTSVADTRFNAEIYRRTYSPELSETLQAVIRKAQTDLGFAQIFEMRRTNSLLAHGFTDIVGAISYLHHTVQVGRISQGGQKLR